MKKTTKQTNKNEDACAGKESLNAKGRVMGEFPGLEAGQQKLVPEADGDPKAKADAERGLLLLYEVLRGMAALSHPRNNTHLPPPIKKQPLCLSTMRSVEQSLYIDDVMMESGEDGGVVIHSRSH